MREPGDLHELGEAGRAGWNARISGYVETALKWYGAVPHLRGKPDAQMSEVTGVDWSGFPVRVAECLSARERACQLLDWTGSEAGPRPLQEEYLEWRVVRDDESEAIRRMEFTTELPEYWGELAAHAPERLLQLVAEFAGEDGVAPEAIYGSLDPHANGTTPELRKEAFEEQVLPPSAANPYNNGEKALCFMVQRSNTLGALVALAITGAVPRGTRDRASKQRRPMNADEAIPRMPNTAEAGRASDPVIVERLGRLAYENRQLAFDDPLGVYIQSVEHTRLRDRDGSPVPNDWFTFSRGVGPAEAGDGRARYQRLSLEVPDEAGYSISDLFDTATERPIRSGGQIADLIQLSVFFRIGAPGVVKAKGPRRRRRAQWAGADPCESIGAYYEASLASNGGGGSGGIVNVGAG